MSIIVVGNGPSILEKNNGDIIDSFDEVIRINHYIPIPEKTGKKVTKFYSTTYEMSERQHYLKIIREINNDAKIIIFNLGQPWITEEHIELRNISSEVNDFLRHYGFNAYPTAPFASTGIVILAELLLENQNTIHIIGFDGIKPNSKLHYFSDEQRISEQYDHSSELEISFVNHFIYLGRLKKI